MFNAVALCFRKIDPRRVEARCKISTGRELVIALIVDEDDDIALTVAYPADDSSPSEDEKNEARIIGEAIGKHLTSNGETIFAMLDRRPSELEPAEPAPAIQRQRHRHRRKA